MTPIEIKALRKEFGATVAVDSIDLSINSGDLFFLLGPSGCGKTTLLRMIAGFTEPTSGKIFFGEREVTRVAPNKRNTGMVFQGYALWPHMTVEQNVAFGLNVRKVPASEKQERVRKALALVQMESYGHRKPNQLSGGQQQRVALARALVIEPTVLLLDEPLSNLDAKLRLEMRAQIKEICKRVGITAVYVTHDQKEALSMADRVALLNQGKVMQLGTPHELYSRPRHRFVADFLGETNFISAVIVGKEADHVVLECDAGRLISTVFPDDLPNSGNVTCSVRPEAIHHVMNGEAAGKPNVLDAKRVGMTYLGEMAQHQLVVGKDMKFKSFELNPKLDRMAEQQKLMIDPSDIVILHD